jgi:hypothetical protein
VLNLFDLEMIARSRHADLLREAARTRHAMQVDPTRDTMRPTLAARLSRLAPDLTRRFGNRVGIATQARSAGAPRSRGAHPATCLSC